jgi:hypothetical protein
MTGRRVAVLAAVAAFVLAVSASASATGTHTGGAAGTTAGISRPGASDCLSHIPGGLDPTDNLRDYYSANCTGHDEPELDPVSSAPGSAQDITWRVQLPADGAVPVSSVGPTFWFGGTVADSNPKKVGGQAFLELQFYPDSYTQNCSASGGFIVKHAPNVYTACSPVWSLTAKGSGFNEPAAFNGMLTDAGGKNAFVMNALDIVDVHIWAPSPNAAYREQVTDETTGQTSSVLVLISQQDGPLTPAYSTNAIGNALDWGGVYDTPMAFVWEIGHADIYGSQNGAFCLPGQSFCGSFNAANWAGITPIRIFGVTYGDGSHQQNWAAVSDTGGKAEVLGNSFVGPTQCTAYGGPYCIYPWFSKDAGGAINYGVDYANTAKDYGQADQFAQTQLCPAGSAFPNDPTYCDTILK